MLAAPLFRCLLAAAALGTPGPRLASAPKTVVLDNASDAFVPAPLDRQQINGLLGRRMRINLEGRLLRVDEAALLAAFERPPGPHPRIGEHAGKFLDAAANAWAYSGDPRLKEKMDRVARTLITAQHSDGYLGTYAAEERWTSWDVWVHGYDLVGLLRYYEVTGYEPALRAARRIGDLLAATFGDSPGRLDLIAAGPHDGLAATSVLEPMCILYRHTGEPRYLEFARYILRAYDQPNGPKIIRFLETTGSVRAAGNGNAYELLANLAGLVELHRLTGDPELLRPALTAWKDIVARRLYVTGTTSSEERFREDFDLPGEESAAVGEGCSTMTWLELNWQLLRLMGEPQYADQLERTIYNQLLGAQDPHSGNLCFFTPLNGRKRPAPGVSCCGSSEPRGIAMIPQLAWGALGNSVAVLLYAPGQAVVPLEPGLDVALSSQTRYPASGVVTVTVRPSHPARFPLLLRIPEWASRFQASVNRTAPAPRNAGPFLEIDRTWYPGDSVRIEIGMAPRVVDGGRSYPDYIAVERGPQVLALDASLNPEVAYLHRAAPKAIEPGQLRLEDVSAMLPKTWTGSQAYSIEGIVGGRAQPLVLVPFADAMNYRVWLVRPGRMPVGQVAVTAFASESWSRGGSAAGSICDERPDTYRDTLEGQPANLDWYAVEMEQPADISRVAFKHGKVFDNGGWFDTSGGKPRIQLKRSHSAPWETVATLETYPAYTGARVPALRDGEPFSVKLASPVRAVAVRITGRPARLFSSCAELEAYAP